MTEEQIIKALKLAQNGDRQAFGELYDHFAEKIYRFTFFRVSHKEVAEDILSDTFVKAWQKINQINSGGALGGWLYQIAKNNIIDYYRLKKDLIPLDELTDELPDAADPLDTLNLGLQQKKVLDVLDQLTEEQQQVIRYKFFEDLSNEEIAYVLGKTEGAIRVIQHRAILKLKELLNNKRRGA